MPFPLPEKFPPGTQFALCAGLPLTCSDGDCTAWDRPGGRAFYMELFVLQGVTCTEAEFRLAVQHWKNLSLGDMSVPILLPTHFPEGTLFCEYEGLPLSEFRDDCTAWNRPGGRWFSSNDFFSRATECTEEEIRRLVAQENAQRK